MNPTNLDELHRALFEQLVDSFAHAALVGMGKLIHPARQKAEVDLEAAQHAIDMLDMLEAKTKGNLTADEERLIKQTAAMLKLNYVEVIGAASASGGQPPQADAASTGTPSPGDSAPTEPPPAEDKVRFRKKYD